MKTYRVTRTYTINVPEDAGYGELVLYFKDRDPEFFEDPRNLDPELIQQQLPYWISYEYDAGNLTELVTDVDATAKEVKNGKVPS